MNLQRFMQVKHAKEFEQGFVCVVAFFTITLFVLNGRKLLSNSEVAEMVWEDCMEWMESFLCPWMACAEGRSDGLLMAAERFVAPCLSQIPRNLPLTKKTLEKFEESECTTIDLYDVIKRENEVRQWMDGDVEDEIPKEETDISFECEESLQESVDLQGEEYLVVEKDDIHAEDQPSLFERKTSFVPHERISEVNLEELQNYEKLVKEFYTIDSTTMAGSDQLNAANFMEKSMKLEDVEGPQILIYHTHSQEAFQDSRPGNPEETVVGVGEELANILREDYGFRVLHHVGEYDKPSRNEAYSRALPAIEAILTENPSIQVVIDLHRDEMPENTRLVTEIDGKKTAKIMFFNGLSRTKRTGNLDYLHNDNLEDNLAFSFQMEVAAKEYYPGLTRKIYLKGYRYNMHLKPKTLLVELGAQNNTYQEALNACGPLAHLLNIVLTGENSRQDFSFLIQ